MNTDSRPWPDNRVTISDSGKREWSCNTHQTHIRQLYRHVQHLSSHTTHNTLCFASTAQPVAQSQEHHHLLCHSRRYLPQSNDAAVAVEDLRVAGGEVVAQVGVVPVTERPRHEDADVLAIQISALVPKHAVRHLRATDHA